jgi:hypothetical protein
MSAYLIVLEHVFNPSIQTLSGTGADFRHETRWSQPTVIWPHFAHRVTLRRGLGFVALSEWSLVKPAHHQVQDPPIALLGSACHWPDPNPKPLRKVTRCAK